MPRGFFEVLDLLTRQRKQGGRHDRLLGTNVISRVRQKDTRYS